MGHFDFDAWLDWHRSAIRMVCVAMGSSTAGYPVTRVWGREAVRDITHDFRSSECLCPTSTTSGYVKVWKTSHVLVQVTCRANSMVPLAMTTYVQLTIPAQKLPSRPERRVIPMQCSFVFSLLLGSVARCVGVSRSHEAG